MNRRPPDPNSVATVAERRRLLDVNRAAAMFYRRELLRSAKGWPGEYLRNGGARAVLEPSANWALGYAPDAQCRLVDHLRSRGFDVESIRNAGLALLDPEGRTVDRFRDQVLFPARNDRLETVGFVGVRGTSSPYYAMSPATQIHRRSGSLVGIAEQLDLLSEGAMPILVNDPLDALAIERISRQTTGRWAAIPLCDTLLSAEQTRILARYAATDTAIVAVTAESQRTAANMLVDLSRTFIRVWAVELPGAAVALSQSQPGRQHLHDALLTTRPLADYSDARRPRRRASPPAIDLTQQDPGPEL
ncbi:hypothetical protein [Kribbella sp. NPDC055071]